METFTLVFIIVVGSVIGALIGMVFNFVVDKISVANGYEERFKLKCNLGLLVATALVMFIYFSK